MDADILIKGGTAVTMTEGRDPVKNARIYVKDGRIADIREADPEEKRIEGNAEIIDATDTIIMPGLINAHTHAAMTIFRGFADDLPLKEWLFERIFPAEKRFLNGETVYWGSLLGCLEMIASGTTSFVDGYFFQDETVQAAEISGLRAFIAQGVIDFPSPDVDDPADNLMTARRFLEKWSGYSELITPGIFCHSPVTCSQRTLVGAREISDEFGLPLQIHLSETIEEVSDIAEKTKMRPVHYLDQLGLLDGGLIAAHAIHCDDSEIEILGRKNVKVVHVPESNMKLCSGAGRISEMLKRGITVALGTDGCCSNNNLDLMCEMDTAAKLGKIFDGDPTSMNAWEVLKMATIGGAAVLGVENEVGTLEKGKKADIITLDLHTPHLCPVYDPLSAIVYSADGGDVKDVIVNGKILMKNREFTEMNPAEIMGKVNEIAGIIARTGTGG